MSSNLTPRTTLFPIFNIESAGMDSVGLIGGFYEWDSEKASVVDLGPDYMNALGVKLHDTESGNVVVLIRPEETLTKLMDLVNVIQAEYDRRKTVPAPECKAAVPNGNAEPFEATAAKAIEALEPDELLQALAAEPAITEAETERDGTLLSNEVICALIQRMARNEKAHAAQIEMLTERLNETEQMMEDEVKRQVEHEVEQQIDGFDFRPVIKDTMDDMDLFVGEDFCEAVKDVVNEMDLDSDEVERIVNEMDLTGKIKEMDLSEVICGHIEKMDMATIVSETLDGMRLFMKIEGTHEGSGSLRVTFGS